MIRLRAIRNSQWRNLPRVASGTQFSTACETATMTSCTNSWASASWSPLSAEQGDRRAVRKSPRTPATLRHRGYPASEESGSVEVSGG